MRLLAGIAVLSMGLVSISVSAADGPCCAHCGCHEPCQKVCRLVQEEKKVEIVCWGCKCEEFCLPGCGERGCRHCDTVCEDCETKAGAEGICSEPQPFVWFDWCPKGCPQMYTKRKLMKKVITKKIPSYKYVVEDLCAQCAAKSAAKPADDPAVTKPTAQQARPESL